MSKKFMPYLAEMDSSLLDLLKAKEYLLSKQK